MLSLLSCVLLRRAGNLFCAVSVILLSLNALINEDVVDTAQVPGAVATCLVCRTLPLRRVASHVGESNMVHLISYSARTTQIYI